jgi:small subunit ribosomal protein S8
MSMQDSIADMFTRIRNAQHRHKAFVSCPQTKFKLSILDVLKREGYIENFETVTEGGFPEVKIRLKYYMGKPVISKIKKISKCSLPQYSSFADLAPVCNGMGIRLVSTSKGVFSDRELRKAFKTKQEKLGGEVIGEVL